jgi:hypothetical protein
MNKVYLSRPARKQKEFIDPKKYHLEGAQEYNIWYGKYIGDISEKMDKEPATSRCNLETDAGYTKADLSNADKKNRRYFCLHFARGMCAKGPECIFYHRIPLPEDDAKIDELFDCFGRQRHNKHKDDMSGVGCFTKPCRTLFVGNLLKSKYETPKALEDALWRHFGLWGELESLNVIHRLSIAFPRYRLRTSAEFAKEAMACQTLDQDEILSIRWAHDDPNPVAKDSIQRADRDALVALMKAKGISLTPAGFDYPVDYVLPEAKRMRLEEGGGILEQHPELAYPDTEAQYAQYAQYYAQYAQEDGNGSTSTSTSTGNPTLSKAETEQAQKDALRRLGLLDDEETAPESSTVEKSNTDATEAVTNEVEDEESSEEEEEGEGGWQQFVDENTGATYYFNTSTGESSWIKPEGYEENSAST